MDTDSSYKVLSGPLHDVIIDSKRREFFESYGEWFVEPYCLAHRKDFIKEMVHGNGQWKPAGSCCSDARRSDCRTPGKFKEEFRGAVIYALNAKTYMCAKDETDLDRDFPPAANESEDDRLKRLAVRKAAESKRSTKGLNKRSNAIGLQQFASVLRDRNAVEGVNTGFIKKNNALYTYSQRRAGLSYFYAKRRVLADGVSTAHLENV